MAGFAGNARKRGMRRGDPLKRNADALCCKTLTTIIDHDTSAIVVKCKKCGKQKTLFYEVEK